MSVTNTITTQSTDQKKEKPVMVKLHELTHCLSPNKCKSTCWHLGPVSLTIHEGEVLAVVGPSGSGKTTLLRVIAGLESSKSGKLFIDDQIVFSENTFVPPEQRKVGMVFQDHALFPHMTVRQNILFGVKHWKKDDQDRRLFELENLLGLRDYINRYPHELSGGQQQRVAVARTLAPKPKVILLDEPLSNIDADLRTFLAQELKSVIKQTGTTAVWVTHDQTEALDLADRIIVMNEGKIEQVDKPWNLYNQPKTRFVANFIGHAVFIQGDLKKDMILTEIGAINCPPCLRNSRKMEVMLRPDDVNVKPHDAGIGTIIKRQFFGSLQLYSISLPSGQIVLSNEPTHINWPIGTKVQLTLKIRSIVAFPLG
jgi:iron(III) transport system ATP-binding protein